MRRDLRPHRAPFFRPEERDWPRLETLWAAFWYPPINEYTVQSPMAHNGYVWGYLAARPTLESSPGR
jgi:hypothetical protein